MAVDEHNESIVPPHSQDAEMSVLGAILLDPNVLGDVAELVGADDFYSEAHTSIFQAILDLDRSSIELDLVTLCEHLTKLGTLDQVGGKAWLVELLEVLPSAANAVHYASIVAEKSLRRKLAAVADNIRVEAFRSPDSAEILLDRAEAGIFEIGEKEAARGTVAVGTVLMDTMSTIEKLQASPGALSGLDTGYFRLNDLTSGLNRGELAVIAARPSMGKTSFALNVALNTSLSEGSRILFFSLEMSEEQIATNLLCSVSRVDAHKIRKGQMSEHDWANLARGADRLHEAPFLIDATPGLTPMAIRTKARRVAMQKGGLDLIIVDYLQLMGSSEKTENRQQEISVISRRLKDLAREMNCPVVALSQLNRSVDAREDHRPRLSDLRESGAIEQDADLIMFLYRDSYYSPEMVDHTEGSVTEVLVAKHRNGPTGKVELVFFPNFLRFENLAAQEVA